jgi:hypothetical protein
MTTTVEQWIHLPASGGAADVFRADQPGGAGIFQVAANNATLACRENGLRTIWEEPGSANVYKNLRVAGDVSSLDLDADDSTIGGAGSYVRLAGRHRIRPYGETGRPTRLHLACRGLAPSPYTLGVLLAVMPDDGAVGFRPGLYASTTTTSTSLVDLAVTLTIDPAAYGREVLPLRGASAVEELGLHTGVNIVVAAWCTSGSNVAKGAIYGLTLTVREP